jgi:hypothetical protein
MYFGKEFFKEFTSNVVLLDFETEKYSPRFRIHSEEDVGYVAIDLMIDDTQFDYVVDCAVMFAEVPILNSIVYPEVAALDEEGIEIIRDIMLQVRAIFEYTVDFYKAVKSDIVTDATEEDIEEFWEGE